MEGPRTEAVRTAADLLGAVTSTVVVLTAVVLYAAPAAMLPVETVPAIGISVVTLSLPLWPVAQAFLHRDAPHLDPSYRQWLTRGALAAIVSFVLGFGIVAARPHGPYRVVGDVLYAVGILLVLTVSVTSLAVRRWTD